MEFREPLVPDFQRHEIFGNDSLRFAARPQHGVRDDARQANISAAMFKFLILGSRRDFSEGPGSSSEGNDGIQGRSRQRSAGVVHLGNARKPARRSAAARRKNDVYWYSGYGQVDFDPKLFAKPENVKIEDSKPRRPLRASTVALLNRWQKTSPPTSAAAKHSFKLLTSSMKACRILAAGSVVSTPPSLRHVSSPISPAERLRFSFCLPLTLCAWVSARDRSTSPNALSAPS
jgi:hypothetical protein